MELLNKSDEIRKVLVSDLTGQLIDSKGVEMEEERTRMLAATFSAMIGAVGSAGDEARMGKTQNIHVGYKEGFVLVSKIGEKGALALITTPEANLGAIRLLAKKYSKKLSEPVSSLAKRMEKLAVKRTSVEEQIPEF